MTHSLSSFRFSFYFFFSTLSFNGPLSLSSLRSTTTLYGRPLSFSLRSSPTLSFFTVALSFSRLRSPTNLSSTAPHSSSRSAFVYNTLLLSCSPFHFRLSVLFYNNSPLLFSLSKSSIFSCFPPLPSVLAKRWVHLIMKRIRLPSLYLR